jgi:hypothetical protein
MKPSKLWCVRRCRRLGKVRLPDVEAVPALSKALDLSQGGVSWAPAERDAR